MFVKMAVIVITISAEMKAFRCRCKIFNRFSNPHNLQGLFAGNAGGRFKIALQCS